MSDALSIAAREIQRGGVVAYPTEACFGLGCDPRNKPAIARIRELKDRDSGQGFILVSDHFDRLLPYLNWNALNSVQQKTIRASWPGPVSWLIPAAETTGRALTGRHNTLAVRLTAFDTLIALCRQANSALLSTSANLRGQQPLMTAYQVEQYFGDKIDCIVDLPVQGLDRPSRIIDAMSQLTLRE